MRFDLAIIDRDGMRLALPTNRARDVTIGTGEHGYEDLTAFLPLPDSMAFALANQRGLRARLIEGGAIWWEGDVEDLTQRNGGVQIAALGDWRRFDDDRYTAFWSSTSTALWFEPDPAAGAAVGNVVNGRFTVNTNNRLFLAPTKGDLFGGTANPAGGTVVGALVLMRPSESTRSLEYVSFTYDVVGPGWTADVARLNDDFTFPGSPVIWTQAGTGAGTFASTITACAGLVLRFYLTGANAVFAGETETYYARLTALRVNGDNSATVDASTIVNDMIAQANLRNPGTFSDSRRLIIPTGLDLTDVVYEDATPTAILADLASKGDTSNRQYEVGVWENREVFFRPAGDGAQSWAVDASELEIEQTLDGLVNSYYATYEDASGRTLRTADQTDDASVARYGRTRRDRVEAKTTSAALAVDIAQTARDATSTPVPRAKVRIRRFATTAGAPVQGYRVRAGDTATIRNLTPTAGETVNRVQTFRVNETTYRLDTDQAEVSPENPIPDIDHQIALTLRRARQG